ncbi:hypothetical protein AAG604_03055 [Citromicrobium bathyomarinum]
MTNARPMTDAFGQAPMFFRSVSLERDIRDPGASRSYVLTGWLERQIERIAEGLEADSTRRAWRMIGDFGVGKSALALALAQALDPRVMSDAMPVRRLLNSRTRKVRRMLPIILTGSANGLAVELSKAIRDALDTVDVDAKARKAVLSTDDPFRALVTFKDAVTNADDFDGVLLVVDEMGRFIEAAEETAADIYELQSLAEAAARSGAAPLCVMLILHKGFQSYAEDWKAARRLEWDKVAERFEELVFDHPLSHTAALVAEALDVDEQAIPTKVMRAYHAVGENIRELGWLGPRNTAQVPECWPIHPGAVPVMSRFFASFGQNERSLFGFLASEEPLSLRDHAARTPIGGDMYGLPEFFDYVATSFGYRLTSRAGAAEWSRIRGVLDRADEADEAEVAVLKSIGMLDLLDTPELRASAESVRSLLSPRFSATEIERAIERLVKGGLLFRRAGRDELRLWTSHRVDLTAVWQSAAREVPSERVVGALGRHLASLPIRSDILARRHSILTGTSRRFSITLTHSGGLKGCSAHDGADGGIVAVLCDTSQDMRMAKAWAEEVTSADPTAIAIAVPRASELEAPLIELLRHRWIASNATSLKEDAHAASEIERTIGQLEQELVTALEDALGLRGGRPGESVVVYQSGREVSLTGAMHVLVSDVCTRTYRDAPLVDNELVNRHVLTSAGAGARQRLIEQMFDHCQDKDLGFDGKKNPPERALYLSILRKGRIHRELGDGWGIEIPEEGDDPLEVRPAMHAIEARLRSSGERVALLDIYDELEGRPFGVRRGLAPLLFAIVLVARSHHVAMFERGTYCTRIDGAAFMRILKGPEHFSFQWVALEGVRADVFRKLSRVFDSPENADEGLRALVDPLIRFGVALPHYTQNASTLGDRARAVRKILANARSPVDLIFTDLPIACDCPAIALDDADGHASAAQQFVERLSDSIDELRACYPTLLERMRSQVIRGTDADDRKALSERAGGLAFRVQDQRLRTFLMRVSDSELGEDSWAEALGGAVVGKPPSRWLDRDVATWDAALEELIGLFLRVETVTFGTGETGRRAVRLALTHADGGEQASIVELKPLTSDQEEAMGAIRRLAAEADLEMSQIAARLCLSEDAAPGSSDENRRGTA